MTLPFEIADLPPTWRRVRLGSLFIERSVQVSDEDFPPLSVTKNGVLPQLETVAKSDNNSSRKLVKAGDFVINSRSDRKGAAGISAMDGSVSPVYTVLTPGAEVASRYVHYLLRSVPFQEEYYRWGSGIAADLWSTRYSAMKRISLPLPPLSEQQVIADYLDRETAEIDALIAAQQRFVGLLQERRYATVASALGKYQDTPVRLKYLANIQTGVTLSGEGDPDDPEWPYLRVANVQTGYVDLGHVKTIRLPRSAAKKAMLRAGDVLLTEGGDIDKLGRGALWNAEIPEALHQNHIFAVRTNLRLDPKFLVYYLDGPIARDYFFVTAKKTTNLASTNKWTVGNLSVGLPSLDVQRHIAAYLDEETAKIDTLIAKSQRHIELARERRSALITASVTGQINVGKAA